MKGIGSKNQYVFISIHKILKLVGGLDEETKAAAFMDSQSATTLVQQYVKNDNIYNRKMALELLLPLLRNNSGALADLSR